jgi:hypothetical protein
MVDESIRLEALEKFILLVVGAIDRPISVLHIEKEIFLLWNFHADVHNYLNFIKHYKGPFSEEIVKIIHHPFYLNRCWDYSPPQNRNDLSGGYIELTDLGRNEYRRLYADAKKRDSLLSLLSGIKMVRELYDNLSTEELLLLIYDTYPAYTEFSKVSKDIDKKKVQLANNLLKNGIIDEKRFKEITIGG